jgi:opacity protein-like surface antigen
MIVPLLALCLALLIPSLAAAEWALDLYGGATRGKIDIDVQIGSATDTVEDLDTDTRFTGGARLGYWFSSAPFFGMGLDVFYMQPDIKNQIASSGGISGQFFQVDIRTIAVAFDVIKLRVPVAVSEQFPHGQFQPSLALGPALFFSEVKDTNNFNPPNQSQRDTRIGFKGNAGATLMLTKAVGLFAEYRFTYYQVEAPFSFSVPPLGTFPVNTTSDLMVHALIGGLTVRFGE